MNKKCLYHSQSYSNAFKTSKTINRANLTKSQLLVNVGPTILFTNGSRITIPQTGPIVTIPQVGLTSTIHLATQIDDMSSQKRSKLTT